MTKKALVQEIINQIEADIEAKDYEALDELLIMLINLDIPKVETLLIGYLSESAKENWSEGRTKFRY